MTPYPCKYINMKDIVSTAHHNLHTYDMAVVFVSVGGTP